jgi:uncharacterized membrane protein
MPPQPPSPPGADSASSVPRAGGWLARCQRLLVTGLLVVLPLAITLWLLQILFAFVNANVSRGVEALLSLLGVENPTGALWRVALPLAGVLVSLGLLIGIGFLTSNFLGRRLLRAFERVVLSLPFVRAIYGGAKQLIDAFTGGGRGAFREVVAIEFSRPGMWMIGFLTSEASLAVDGPEPMCSVFVPTTPNPTSGFLFLVAAKEIRRLDLSVEDAIKLIVSGGLVLPEASSVHRG